MIYSHHGRAYLQCKALSGGVVLVDLPGVHDANAARAAIADSYIQKCTRLWVVAQIGRASDDSAAKKYISGQLERQLQMDGAMSSTDGR